MRCATHSRVSCPNYACQQEAKANRSPTDTGVVRFPDPYQSVMLGDDESDLREQH